MSSSFGRKFREDYGDDPNADWALEVDKLTLEQLTRGVEHYARTSREFAPTLGQFIEACRGGRQAPTHKAPSRLPGPAPDTKRGLEWLAYIRIRMGRAGLALAGNMSLEDAERTLEGVDVEAMGREVERARAEIYARHGATAPNARGEKQGTADAII